MYMCVCVCVGGAGLLSLSIIMRLSVHLEIDSVYFVYLIKTVDAQQCAERHRDMECGVVTEVIENICLTFSSLASSSSSSPFPSSPVALLIKRNNNKQIL